MGYIPEWIERLGLPVALLAFMILFVWRVMWPYHVRQIEAKEAFLQDQLQDQKEEKRTAIAELTKSLNRHAEEAQKMSNALQELAEEIRRRRR